MPTVSTRLKARCRPLVLGTSWALTSTLTTTLAVANPADFYKGKTVTYSVATSPGGSCDLTGRLVADFMQKQLPCSKFVVKNVPGASKEPVPFATGNEGEMAMRRGEVVGGVGSRSSPAKAALPLVQSRGDLKVGMIGEIRYTAGGDSEPVEMA